MKALWLGVMLTALSADDRGRTSDPILEGRGNGVLTVLEVPEKVPLEFYLVQCVRPMSGGCTFSVQRSGREATPPTAVVGETYREKERHVSFRIEAGDVEFAEGDTFSFVTFSGEDSLEKLFDRWLDQYVKWIISNEERERFLQLESPIDKIGFIESFWRRRDPTPRTPENEARDEHARRFAYAVRHFGAGVPGWSTDRGKIYILLGAPHSIQRNPAGRTAFERPSEVWTYNNLPNPKLPASLDIGFVDFTGTGRFEIVNASNLDAVAPLRTNLGYSMSELEAIGLMRSGGTLMDQTTGFRSFIDPTRLSTDQFEFQRELREVQEIPTLNLPSLTAITEASARFPTLPLATQAAIFRAGEHSALVPVTISMPYARLSPRPHEDGYVYAVDVLIQVRDESGELQGEPVEDRLEVRAQASELEAYRQSELLYETSFTLPPGRYEVETLLRDNPSGALGQTMTAVEVPPFASSGLGASTLLLASGAIEADPPPVGAPRPPFQFGNLRLVPNVNRRFSMRNTMTAYLQVYGFARSSEDDAARLRVEFFILREGRLYSKVAPSYHRPLGREETAIKSDISLTGFPPGEYVLRARVTDELSGAKTEQDGAFTVSR